MKDQISDFFFSTEKSRIIQGWFHYSLLCNPSLVSQTTLSSHNAYIFQHVKISIYVQCQKQKRCPTQFKISILMLISKSPEVKNVKVKRFSRKGILFRPSSDAIHIYVKIHPKCLSKLKEIEFFIKKYLKEIFLYYLWPCQGKKF